MPFAFVGASSQAHVQNSLADNADANRALAIPEEVEREFSTDKNRACLTGVSMDAESVWSLAAARRPAEKK